LGFIFRGGRVPISFQFKLRVFALRVRLIIHFKKFLPRIAVIMFSSMLIPTENHELAIAMFYGTIFERRDNLYSFYGICSVSPTII